MKFLLGFIIPILSYFFQVYPRIFNRYFGIDVWKRMIEADIIRKNKHHIPKGVVQNGFIIEGYFDYPPVFPWLLSFIPKKILLQIQGFIAPIFDCIQNYLVFLITLQLSNRVDIALIAQVIYFSTPIAALENSYLTPRSLGYLNFTLAFYPILMYQQTHALPYLYLGYIFTTLIFFSHRFPTQALLFISIFFTIIDRDLIYLSNYLVAFITAIIISRGYYLKVLKGHLTLIYFWILNYKFRFAHQIRGNFSNDKSNKMDFVSFIYYLLSTFTPISLIATNIWLCAPIAYVIDKYAKLNLIPIDNPLFLKMSLWVVFFYILSTVVLSIKYFIPIGEGQRYLEMALVPTSILAAMILSAFLNTPYKTTAIIIYLSILIINILLTIYAQWKGVITDKSRSLTKELPGIFSYLNQLKYRPRIICVPHAMNLIFLYNTKVDALVDIEVSGLLQLQEVFPILRTSIKDLAKKYDLNLLILKKSYANAEELKIPVRRLLKDVGDIQIYNVKNL